MAIKYGQVVWRQAPRHNPAGPEGGKKAMIGNHRLSGRLAAFAGALRKKISRKPARRIALFFVFRNYQEPRADGLAGPFPPQDFSPLSGSFFRRPPSR